MSRIFFLWAAGLLCALAGCQSSTPVASAASCAAPLSQGHWVAAWGSPPTDTGDTYQDQSLRMVLSPRFHGGMVRVHLSNRFSTSAVTFSNASIGLQKQGAALIPGSVQMLHFSCANQVTLQPGEEILSDPVPLSFTAFQNVAVSLHVSGNGGASTRHSEAWQTSYIAPAAAGDLTVDESGSGFTTTTTSVNYVRGLETYDAPGSGAIVAFGDSITDGTITTGGSIFNDDPAAVDQNLRWPDFLARRLAAAGLGNRYSVVNSGIGGNRLLSDALIGFPGFGPSGLSRLDSDVADIAGVTTAIILIGSNDLGMVPPATGDQVIAGLEQAVSRLHARGIRVLLATQTPCSGVVIVGGHGLPYAVAFRKQINDWVRTQTIADGVIDFYPVLGDPNNPDALNPAYGSGDNLHPNAAGYSLMADTVNLALLQP